MLPGRQLRTRLFRYPFLLCNPFHSASDPSVAFFTGRSSDETYCWNLAISGYLRRKNPRGAFSKYAQMRRTGVEADSHTLGFLLKGCVSMVELQQAHSHALMMGFTAEVIVQTALLSSYALLSELHHARKLFDETPHRDLPLWNAIISAYSQLGNPLETLNFTRAMMEEGLRPNEVTATSVLSACTALKDLFNGKILHGFILKTLPHHDTLLCSALLSFYARCGAVDIARRWFDEMPNRDLITWTAMIAAFSENNCLTEAFYLFKDMAAAGLPADEVTVLTASSSAGMLRDPDAAEFVDNYACRQHLSHKTRVTNSLILMHARCGSIHRACKLFDEMPQRTQVSWTSIIQALATNGRGREALLRFSQMQISGVVPDELCYISVLSGCNRCGMVEEARKCFKAMVEEHGLIPWIEHYASMVDLLCREGFLDEALGFLGRMPMKPDERLIRVFLRGCEKMGKPGMAARVLKEVFRGAEIQVNS